jgi:predicted TIM-barrel fold metal-dependent hydrolase
MNLKSFINLLLSLVLLSQFALAKIPFPPTPVIDVHVHTNYPYYPITDEILKSNGISRWINLSGGSQLQTLAKHLQVATQFQDRVAVCVNIPWKWLSQAQFEERIIQFLSEAKYMGAKCIKIPKSLGLFIPDPQSPNQLLKINDPTLNIIWQQAGLLDLPIFIHIGDPWAFFDPLSPQNERYDELSVHPDWSFADPKFPRPMALLMAFEEVLVKFKQTTFIGVHFANCAEDLGYVRYALDRYPNLYADIAARLPEFGRHRADQVSALFEDFPDRFLFGTDLGIGQGIMLGSVGREEPMIFDIFEFYEKHWQFFQTNQKQMVHPTPIQGPWKIDAIGLSTRTLEKLYYENALKLIWKLDDLAIQKQKKEDGLLLKNPKSWDELLE